MFTLTAEPCGPAAVVANEWQPSQLRIDELVKPFFR
jgi:hypothetical protein